MTLGPTIFELLARASSVASGSRVSLTWRQDTGETMAIGKRKSSGDFLPMLKYDARVGTLYLQDRVYSGGHWETEQRDITKEFRAAFDLANLQRGWIKFPKGAAPETRLAPIAQDYGEALDDDFKEGIRVLVKMDTSLGGNVRELMSTAVALWNAMDALHDAYLASADQHPGALPVVDLAETTETKTSAGTSVAPVFKIVGWIPRPPDLPIALAGSTTKQKQKVKASRSADFDDPIPFDR
jgi:hypothetical protein